MSAGVIQPRMIVGHLAHEALKRYGTFDLTDEQISALLDEAGAFFDRPTIRLRLLSPVLNVHGPREIPPISFPEGVTMRPITDEEFTDFYGGNPIFGGARNHFYFPDFVFVRDIEIPKVIGKNAKVGNGSFWEPHQELLDRCVLALASFKDGGAIGYDGARITPLEMAFGAAFGVSHLWGNEHVPTATYSLTAEDVPQLEEHARHFERIHPSLEMACQRLVDSSRRTKPRDGIIDAVIGLESILLTDVGEKQRGENRFRFSLNYASLSPLDKRKEAFNTARGLYDLRSLIAHGGQPSTKEKINGQDMSLPEIAALARSILRAIITRFLPNATSPDFMTENFWTNRTLGLGDQHRKDKQGP